MSNFPKKQWREMKDKGENIGPIFIVLGVSLLVIIFALLLSGKRTEIGFLAVSISLISVGLGFTAIGLSAKADKKYTEILERMDANIVKLLKGQDIIVTPRPAALVIKTFAPEVIVEHKSKESAQKRLDEDTKRVGFVRGELYQLKDGSWGIAWGGKYPL
jgi:hypothetical protein